MDEPIEDRIAKRGVADELMPVVDGHLARDQRGAPATAVFNDFEEIASLAIPEGRQPPIVQLCEASHNWTNDKRAVMWSTTGNSLRPRIIWGR